MSLENTLNIFTDERGLKRMKKIPFMLALLLFVLSIVSACSGNTAEGDSNSTDSDSSDEAGETINLTWYYPVNVGGEITSVIDAYAEDFNNEEIEVNGKKVTVSPVYSGNYDETMIKVQTAIQNGEAPDLAVLLSADLFQIMDAVVPLDDFIEQDPELQEIFDDFFPGFMYNSQNEGQTYSVPFQR